MLKFGEKSANFFGNFTKFLRSNKYQLNYNFGRIAGQFTHYLAQNGNLLLILHYFGLEIINIGQIW